MSEAILDNFDRWLMQPIRVTPRSDAPHGTTIGERLAELIAVNGFSLAVGGFGIIAMGGGLYGRQGLDSDEAWQLTHLGAVVEGFSRAGGDDPAWQERFKAAFSAHMELRWARREAALAAARGSGEEVRDE